MGFSNNIHHVIKNQVPFWNFTSTVEKNRHKMSGKFVTKLKDGRKLKMD